MSVLIRAIVAIPLLLLLVIMAWITGIVIGPFAGAVFDVAGGTAFIGPVTLVVQVGVRFVLAGLGLAVAVWWIFGSLRQDRHHAVHRRHP